MSLSNNYPTDLPVLNLDFANTGVLDPRITFTRATTATYYDYAGVLRTAASGVPRFDYNPTTLVPQGLLIEEARTNSIRNNTMQGAVAGSPGTLPTNWAWSATTAGLTVEVVGTGVEGGVTYIDLKMSGTADGTAFTLGFEPSSIVTASSGQTWTLSAYSRIVAGSLSNIVYNLSITEQNGGTVLTSGALAVTPTTAALNSQRFTFTRTLTNASTNNIRPRPRFDTTAGAVDLTLRIGLPQLELGAFATSVIPTTTTALTRNADVASMTGTNFSSWFNASGGTVVTNFAFVGLKSVAGQRIISFDDGSSDNLLIQVAQSNNTLATSITDAGSSQMAATTPATTFAANTAYKMGFAYALNNSVAAINGTAGTVDTSCTIPTGITTFRLAASSAASTANCWYSRISFYPTRLTNAQLQALTGS